MNSTAATVVMTTPAIASGWESASRLVTVRLLQAQHVGDERVDVRGRQRLNLAGIGGFLVDFALAVISTGFTIHSLMSAADSFAPTPSSGLALLPLPAMLWQTEHF